MATSRARGTANDADVLTDDTTVLTVLGAEASEADKLAKLAAEADVAVKRPLAKVEKQRAHLADAEAAATRAQKEAERAHRAADKASN